MDKERMSGRLMLGTLILGWIISVVFIDPTIKEDTTTVGQLYNLALTILSYIIGLMIVSKLIHPSNNQNRS